MIINNFSGANDFYSNFYECRVVYEGLVYPNSENAFQAAKVWIEGDLEATNRERVRLGFTAVTPGQAKRIGRKRDIGLRDNWDNIKDDIMYNILKAKFTQNEDLRQKLLAGYPATLIEGNYWHDNYWGCCSCSKCSNKKGQNRLGQALMWLREELRK